MLSYLAIKIVCDHINRRSKGHGLVWFTSKTMVTIALKEMDGQVNLVWHDIIIFALQIALLSA